MVLFMYNIYLSIAITFHFTFIGLWQEVLCTRKQTDLFGVCGSRTASTTLRSVTRPRQAAGCTGDRFEVFEDFFSHHRHPHTDLTTNTAPYSGRGHTFLLLRCSLLWSLCVGKESLKMHFLKHLNSVPVIVDNCCVLSFNTGDFFYGLLYVHISQPNKIKSLTCQNSMRVVWYESLLEYFIKIKTLSWYSQGQITRFRGNLKQLKSSLISDPSVEGSEIWKFWKINQPVTVSQLSGDVSFPEAQL